MTDIPNLRGEKAAVYPPFPEYCGTLDSPKGAAQRNGVNFH